MFNKDMSLVGSLKSKTLLFPREDDGCVVSEIQRLSPSSAVAIISIPNN